jgi:uncharacterized repeat protein (TIGR03803 family)
MTISGFSSLALTCAAVASLAGCGGSQIGAPGTMAQSRGVAPHNERSGSSQSTSSVPDGFGPSSRLVALRGKLYGTTGGGGDNNEGTVYRITTSGEENVVYSFAPGCRRNRKCPDGWIPTDLVRVNRTLYGSTLNGGRGHCPHGCGTVFRVTPSGAETVLYSFESRCPRGQRCHDASYSSGLIANDGTLYGTSYFGGTYGYGTVYSVTTSGVEKVIYSFAGPGYDGSVFPGGGVVNVNGTLYGTTFYGGAQSAGFVFSMSTSGRMNVLYSFDAPTGGGSAAPSGLIDVNGVLYGTTGNGGAYQKGTLFSITTNGTVAVLYSFGAGCHPGKRCSDGEYPYWGGDLLDVKGTLYGVTTGGGAHASGTVFSVTTSGSEKVLHSFSQAVYGPAAALTELNGILYGTTGGGICDGGTVYSMTLSGKTKRLHTFC